jgi:hypothetical protein
VYNDNWQKKHPSNCEIFCFQTQQHISGFATGLYDYVLIKNDICN